MDYAREIEIEEETRSGTKTDVDNDEIDLASESESDVVGMRNGNLGLGTWKENESVDHCGLCYCGLYPDHCGRDHCGLLHVEVQGLGLRNRGPCTYDQRDHEGQQVGPSEWHRRSKLDRPEVCCVYPDLRSSTSANKKDPSPGHLERIEGSRVGFHQAFHL